MEDTDNKKTTFGVIKRILGVGRQTGRNMG
jgi:hypothetical protein